MAGANLPARWASFPNGEGALCRPPLNLPPIFFLLSAGTDLTNLPYDGSTPRYPADLRLSLGLATNPPQHARTIHLLQKNQGQIAQEGYNGAEGPDSRARRRFPRLPGGLPQPGK